MPDRDALFIGLMSGTSVDGIDAALCRFEGSQVQTLAAHNHAWPERLREQLLAVAQGERQLDLDRYGQLDVAVGQQFAAATLALLKRAGAAAAEVTAIGSHGQTIRHRPYGDTPFTLQIGDASVIAERTGIDTVADFRRADVAAGGQGAPLMPAFHAAVLGADSACQVVLNLGGIANITVLGADRVLGLDTGPANGLMDAWCQRHTGQRFDAGGAFAASGKHDDVLLSAMLADPYFSQPAPKSTGREYFHLAWLERFGVAALAPADVQATLLALTAQSVADAVHRHAPNSTRVLVCGGGVHNEVLMQALTAALPARRVQSVATIGLDPDHVEAAGFAWLAMRRLRGLPGNLPAVTGAAGPRLLGVCYAAPRPVR
ncbi:anhydro-N-acetylmuramic acid kinase [Oleiagrimonas sp. C23AA]|uniref:anhydro-N-acetylmuramic acid kinase n=1 Tax=Oleiagrimonas sp. C23AA TaxID=2719047 RepID=UPI00141D9F81|nr:anhydro-N-acetylmuramic acid kinase [Oleiagrimonas sp. C23AA]NII10585.1 anhydro-N-acetylmuramic acid kinase [Oleiagrimonas sp. C23AA]